MDSKIVAYFYLAAAMSIAGSSFVVGKILIVEFPLFLLCGLRFLCALLVLCPLLIWKKQPFRLINGGSSWIFFLQAFTGIFLFNVFLLWGLQKTTTINSGVIVSTAPVMIAILSWRILKEKLTNRTLFAILASTLGLVILNSGPANPHDTGENIMFGNILVLGATLSEALFVVLGKLITTRITPLAATTLVSFYGFLLFLPFALLEVRAFGFSMLTLNHGLLIIYNGIIVTVVAFVFLYRGLARVSAGTAAVFTGFIPLSTTILSCFFLNERVRDAHLWGSVLILAGILLGAPRDGADKTSDSTTKSRTNIS